MYKVLFCAALLVALPMPLWAEGGPNPAEARAHYEQGLSAYALEHFAEAADEYEKAFHYKADPALLYNAAQAHRLAGNYERALHLYQSYLRIFGKKATNRVEVERHIAELETTVATQKHAQESPPTGIAEPESSTTQASAATTGPAPTSTTVVEAPPTPSVNVMLTAPAPKPVYKKAWLWGTVVGGVAVVALGVGLGVGLSNRDPAGSIAPISVH